MKEESLAKETLDIALSHYENGEYSQALGALATGFSQDIENPDLYALAAKCLGQFEGAEAEAKLFSDAQNDLNNFDSFVRLGDHFFSEDHYNLARTFYKRANHLDPKNGRIAHDYALVLARKFQIKEAINILEIADPTCEFWNYYFWCKLNILNGETEGIEEGLNSLLASLDQEPNQEDAAFPRQKVKEVKEILQRYNVIENPRNDVQDWHFIQYGGAILDLFYEPDHFVAGGRYVALWGSHTSIKETLLQLKSFLKQMDIPIKKIRFIDDRDSEIIGLAAAKIFGIKGSVYQPNEYLENCLIVGANSINFDGSLELSESNNNQIVFSLNHHWLDNANICPDVTGFMSQSYYFPWDSGYSFNAETGKQEPKAPDEREPSAIAEDIFQAEFDESKLDTSFDFYVKHKKYLKTIGNKTSNQRYNFVIESPVPGSHFN